MAGTKEYDYIIVGAGSAGCVLAYRLGADPNNRILVLEAGGPDTDPLIHIPLGLGKMHEKRAHDWGYDAEPEERLNGREIEAMRGKVVGGSSSINVMAYVRGHRGDYDRWAANGATGWSYADVLPYFRRMETWEGGEDTWRGGEGPLQTQTARSTDPLWESWIEAGKATGLGFTEDYNGVDTDGFCIMQSTVRRGLRCSASVAYLRPAMKRPNLTVSTKSMALEIIMKGTRAVGIKYAHRGKTYTAYAASEVILCGGVINSPHILMLSGIGSADELAEQNINCKVDLPNIGKNLQDHLSVGVEYERKEDGPFVNVLRFDKLLAAMARAYIFGDGFATAMPGPVMAFLKSDPTLLQPDVQFLTRFVPPESQPWFPGYRTRPKDAFMCRPVILHPESRGYVKLNSSNPLDPIAIHGNFLSTQRDRDTLRTGFEMVRDVASQKSLDPFRGVEINPGPDCRTRKQIDAFIRRTAWTVHHPLGTCKMGAESDETTVVDPNLRVRGVENLRVVDASVIPDMPGGNINSPVIAIAERAADLIRYNRPLAPATF